MVLVTFAVPLPLFLRLSPYYLVVAVFLLVLWFMFARAVHLSSDESRTDPRWARLVALVLSLTVVQSVFEPDYGSYVRHLTPMLPLMLAVILWRPRAFGGPGAPTAQASVRVPGDADVPAAAR